MKSDESRASNLGMLVQRDAIKEIKDNLSSVEGIKGIKDLPSIPGFTFEKGGALVTLAVENKGLRSQSGITLRMGAEIFVQRVRGQYVEDSSLPADYTVTMYSLGPEGNYKQRIMEAAYNLLSLDSSKSI